MQQLQKFLTKLLRGVGTPLSSTVLPLVEAGAWVEIQNLPQKPLGSYSDSEELVRDNLVYCIVKKCTGLGLSPQLRKQNALDTFFIAEADCLRTNARLTRLVDNSSVEYFPEKIDLAAWLFIKAWRKEVARVLGKLPMRLDLFFSKGSTLSNKGLLTTIPDKMSGEVSIYSQSIAVWKHTISGTALDQLHQPLRVVEANELFTVPKNASIDRLAAMEASASLSLQLAVGREMRRRYERYYQVDFDKLQSVHRDLARDSSIDGSLATIDLSSASDTVSKKLVELILPEDWYTLLNSLRARSTMIDNKSFRNEKFSTMGNGFTFDLETLLFQTLCRAAGSMRSSVYGDDIIVETEKAADILAYLQYFGFTPNQKKTFCEGPFRESCGGDFFRGDPVRGHYMKEPPDEPQHWVALANGLLRADPLQKWSKAAWWYCVDQVPVVWRSFGPAELGDSLFTAPSSEFETPVDIQGDKWYPGMIPVTPHLDVSAHFYPDVVLAAALFGVPSLVAPRDSVTGYRPALTPRPGSKFLPYLGPPTRYA